MATQRATEEDVIRRRIDRLVEAVRAMDLEAVMPIYAPDLVSFDIVPPLQHLGADAKRKNWINVFTAYERPLGYEIRDLTIIVADDLACTRSLNRISGTLKNGSEKGYWLRWSTVFRKIDGQWLMVHDQVSLPFDPASGLAVQTLEP